MGAISRPHLCTTALCTTTTTNNKLAITSTAYSIWSSKQQAAHVMKSCLLAVAPALQKLILRPPEPNLTVATISHSATFRTFRGTPTCSPRLKSEIVIVGVVPMDSHHVHKISPDMPLPQSPEPMACYCNFFTCFSRVFQSDNIVMHRLLLTLR